MSFEITQLVLVCLSTLLAGASLGQALARDLDPASLIAGRPVRSADNGIVPVSVENGQVIVNAIINDQGPFPMMFDTGGVEAITPDTATALGLLVEGQGIVRGSGERAVSVALTHLHALRLGGAELSDKTLPVIPKAIWTRSIIVQT
jgi:hypothetical protein